MSEETLNALVQAAKAFKNDPNELPALRAALEAHDADEGTAPTPEPPDEGTSTGTETTVELTEAPEGTTVTP